MITWWDVLDYAFAGFAVAYGISKNVLAWVIYGALLFVLLTVRYVKRRRRAKDVP